MEPKISECKICSVILTIGSNWYVSMAASGSHVCTECHSTMCRKNEHTLEGWLGVTFRNARTRARRFGTPFELDTWRDLPPLPTHCPVTGIKFKNSFNGKQGPCNESPTLDRIIPELGYVPGNIQWLSHKANRFKSDKSLADLRAQAQCKSTIATIAYIEESI